MFESHIKSRSTMPLCPLCRNEFDSYYRTPRVIPKCGHTLCQKCINSNIISKSNRRILICPTCASETIIRKNNIQQIPKNIQILDIAKSIKKKQYEYEQSSPLINHNNYNNHNYHNNSPHNHNNNSSYLSYLPSSSINAFNHELITTKQQTYCSQHPQKPLDLICQTCDYAKVCSICVLLIKNHQNHKFVQYVPASKIDLSEVNEIFTIIENSVNEAILPEANYNIIKKTEQNIIHELMQTVARHFRQNYYKVIEKKQQQIIKQCKQIKLQLPVYNKIEQITKIYDSLRIQYHDIQDKKRKKQISLSIIQQFIVKCKHLHNQIESFSEYSENEANKIIKQIKNKIVQTHFVKCNQISVTLKNILSSTSNLNTNYNKLHLQNPQKINSIIKSPLKNKKDAKSFLQIRNNTKSVNENQTSEFDTKTVSILCQNDEIKSRKNRKDNLQSVKQSSSSVNLIPIQSINSIKNLSNNSRIVVNVNPPANMPPRNPNITNNNNKTYIAKNQLHSTFDNFNSKNSKINPNNSIIRFQHYQQQQQNLNQTNIPKLQLAQSKSIKIASTTTSNTDRIHKKTNISAQNANVTSQHSKSITKQTAKGIIQKLSPYKSNTTQMKSNLQLNQTLSIHNTSICNFNSDHNSEMLKIKQVRPNKQLSLNLKTKFNAIMTELTRQSTSASLQLISMQINDNLLIYLCDYLRVKKIKFQMIKLVKNQITDEGISILFGYLANDDVTQVLNLTSNQLTCRSVQMLLQLGKRNKMLKTIYLGNNKINSLNLKQKKKQIQDVGIQIII